MIPKDLIHRLQIRWAMLVDTIGILGKIAGEEQVDLEELWKGWKEQRGEI